MRGAIITAALAACSSSSSRPAGQIESGQETSASTTDSSPPTQPGVRPPTQPGPLDERRPNIIVVMTDDQRWDSLWAMPLLQTHMIGRGTVFENAYVNTPVCCPTRASLLAGGFLSQDTGVLANYEPNGSAIRFDDTRTLSVRFQGAGYRTAHIGKYLHGAERPIVPPGWDTWIDPVLSNENWNKFMVVEGSSGAEETEGTQTSVKAYLTDFLTDHALDFIEPTDERPFLLWLDHYAPHYPSIPAEQDVGMFEGETLRVGAYDEEDVSDKPEFVRESARIDAHTAASTDAGYQKALESLQAVDRSIAALLDRLEETDQLDNTYLVFTSDNGQLWGEHRLFNKGYHYQESIRVPLIIRGPDILATANANVVSVTTDMPTTLYDIAGIDAPTGGRSLLGLLRGEPNEWEDTLLIEGYGLAGCPNYAGLVTERWKYVAYTTGESELYDLLADPHEQQSLHNDVDSFNVMDVMARNLKDRKGLSAVTTDVAFHVGEPLDVELEAWGGTEPYSWSVDESTLPPGLSLTTDGRIQGTSDSEKSAFVEIMVTDSGSSPYSGEPQQYVQVVRMHSLSAGPSEQQAPRLLTAGPNRAVFDLPDAGWKTVLISAIGDFDDARRIDLRGVGQRLVIDGLGPARRYEALLEGSSGRLVFSFSTTR